MNEKIKEYLEKMNWNVWKDVTTTTQTSGGEWNTLDGAACDADHDGDLDLFLINTDGANELLNNNLDGTFRPLGQSQGLGGDGRPSRRIVVADLDNDRDTDLVVINEQPPHEVYFNDRLWNYHQGDGFEKLCNTPITAAVAADRNADGQVELYTLTTDGLCAWSPNEAGHWLKQVLVPAESQVSVNFKAPFLAVCDVNGTGQLEILFSTQNGWAVVAENDLTTPAFHVTDVVVSQAVVGMLDAVQGPSVIGLSPGRAPLVWGPGEGRLTLLGMMFSGRDDVGQQMRSNASGIGVRAAIRAGSNWSVLSTHRMSGGPGQSLQPVAIGLNGASRADFIRLNWPDGLIQTEMNLSIGQVHRIRETQRQTSSCPVLFAWNGTSYRFVTDILGVGGLGFNLANGQYAPVRPWENLLLPESALRPRQGHYEIKIGEPMEELCYLDSVRLVQYDLPPGWQMTLDERSAVSGPEPSGDPVFYQHAMLPTRAINDRGDNVIASILSVDGIASPTGELDPRFLGHTKEHRLEIAFQESLNDLPGHPVLVFDGWIEYPYSQTMFAAWQAGVEYAPPTLDARDLNGKWQTVLPKFGYMAGMPRQATVPIATQCLPEKTRQLRLTTNMEIYWDRVMVVAAQVCPQVERRELPLVCASVAESGFSRRTTPAQGRPFFDYGHRVPLWDTRHQVGFYTEFGDALALVSSTDDAVAIIGPGEEVHLHFKVDDTPLRRRWTRRFVLEANGWCKDMDLYSRDGERVAPLPWRETGSSDQRAHRERLHGQFNRRYRGG